LSYLREIDRPPYSRAPIVEAVVQINVEPSVDSIHLSDMFEGQVEPSFNIASQFKVVDDQLEGETSASLTGYVFRDAERGVRIGAQQQSFYLSRSRPYTEWSDFIDEVEKSWLIYKGRVEPSRVTQLGVRYVNRIDVPSPQVEFKDYLRTSVDVSSYLPQSVSGLFMRIEVPLPAHEASVAIASAMLPPSKADHVSLLLDIDVTAQIDLNVGDPAFDKDLRARLDVLRDAKNYVFEACITDATRRLIE
jgi:uncharacterized protein (TIGR04255 family)